jgi:hypothetical protein
MTYVPPMTDQQECRICKVTKPFEAFHQHSKGGKYRTDCKECRCAIEAARRYGVTTEHVDALLEKQGACCAICGSDGKDHATFTRLVIDHCHTTGKVRGMLCAKCNIGLGNFNDQSRLLLKAAVYLQQTM